MTRRALFGCLLAAILIIAVPLPSLTQDTCPAEGSPKPGEGPLSVVKKDLNKLKNRTELPSSVQPMKVGDILTFDDQRNSELEKKGVVLEGFLLGFKHEGPESPNCYSDTRLDFHMWMGTKRPPTPDAGMAMRVHSVVVEPTPAMQEAHPTWHEENFKGHSHLWLRS